MPGTGLGLYIVARLHGALRRQRHGAQPRAGPGRQRDVDLAGALVNAAHILVVDDEAHLAAGIRENLAAEGYRAQAPTTAPRVWRKALDTSFDLIVLDVNMPAMDGLAVCRELRSRGCQTPVLFLTVKGDAADRIRGLEAGGDDYMAKPFHLRELLLRIQAILRRSVWYGQAHKTLCFGGNEVDFETYQARSLGRREPRLTHKEP